MVDVDKSNNSHSLINVSMVSFTQIHSANPIQTFLNRIAHHIRLGHIAIDNAAIKKNCFSLFLFQIKSMILSLPSTHVVIGFLALILILLFRVQCVVGEMFHAFVILIDQSFQCQHLWHISTLQQDILEWILLSHVASYTCDL